MNGPQYFAAGKQALAKAEDIPSEALEFERQIQLASLYFQAAHVAAVIDTAAANRYGGSHNGEAWRNALDGEVTR